MKVRVPVEVAGPLESEFVTVVMARMGPGDMPVYATTKISLDEATAGEIGGRFLVHAVRSLAWELMKAEDAQRFSAEAEESGGA